MAGWVAFSFTLITTSCSRESDSNGLLLVSAGFAKFSDVCGDYVVGVAFNEWNITTTPFLISRLKKGLSFGKPKPLT